MAAVIRSSPKTLLHSRNGRFAVMIAGVCSQRQESGRNRTLPPVRETGRCPSSSRTAKSRRRRASARRPCRPSLCSRSRRLAGSTTLKKRPRAPSRMQARATATARCDFPVPVPPARTQFRQLSMKSPPASRRTAAPPPRRPGCPGSRILPAPWRWAAGRPSTGT